ncbi:MAG: hypothetical protein IKR85_06240 [Clostridia bacterium]|nr:hypothetical protein [Clostridia bacterium]
MKRVYCCILLVLCALAVASALADTPVSVDSCAFTLPGSWMETDISRSGIGSGASRAFECGGRILIYDLIDAGYGDNAADVLAFIERGLPDEASKTVKGVNGVTHLGKRQINGQTFYLLTLEDSVTLHSDAFGVKLMHAAAVKSGKLHLLRLFAHADDGEADALFNQILTSFALGEAAPQETQTASDFTKLVRQNIIWALVFVILALAAGIAAVVIVLRALLGTARRSVRTLRESGARRAFKRLYSPSGIAAALCAAALSAVFEGGFGLKPFIVLLLLPPIESVSRTAFRGALRRRAVCVSAALALVLGILYACGSSLGSYGSVLVCFENAAGVFALASGALAAAIMIYHIFNALCALARRISPARCDGENAPLYGRLLYRRPFLTSALTLFGAYTPYMILSYPAIFMGDTPTMLLQAAGDMEMSSIHSAVYTWLLGAALKGGCALLGSYNAAVFVFMLAQTAFMVCALANGVKLLIEEARIKWQWALGVMCVFVLSARFVNYLMILSKDVCYCACVLLSGEAMYVILRRGSSAKRITLLCAAVTGMLLFRNDGLVPAILMLAALLVLMRGKVRLGAFTLAGTLGFYILYNTLLLPALGAGGVSKRDLYGNFIQQTGRYVNAYRSDVTEGEEKAILAAFEFESLNELAEAYNPNRSDELKTAFIYDTARPEADAYMRTWSAMGKRHPGVYIEAWFANHYQYLYPQARFSLLYHYAFSLKEMYLMNAQQTLMGGEQVYFYPSELTAARTLVQFIHEGLMYLPPFTLLNSPAVLTYSVLGMCAYCIITRRRDGLVMCAPLLGVLTVCMLAPCNGYYGRYQYPLMACVPFLPLALHGRTSFRKTPTEIR